MKSLWNKNNRWLIESLYHHELRFQQRKPLDKEIVEISDIRESNHAHVIYNSK